MIESLDIILGYRDRKSHFWRKMARFLTQITANIGLIPPGQVMPNRSLMPREKN